MSSLDRKELLESLENVYQRIAKEDSTASSLNILAHLLRVLDQGAAVPIDMCAAITITVHALCHQVDSLNKIALDALKYSNATTVVTGGGIK